MTAPGARGPLRQAFDTHDGRAVVKWLHYFEVYERWFSQFRGRPITMIEIGVLNGGSLQLWRDYLGPEATIVGIDVDPRCQIFADAKTPIFIGSQADADFLEFVLGEVGAPSIVLDDGGHRMDQQRVSFDTLYPGLADGGVYICEDTHTSYWDSHDGGLRRHGTFIEYAKGLVDDLHAWHSREPGFEPTWITESTDSISFHDSMVIFHKRAQSRPVVQRRGNAGYLPDDLERLLALYRQSPENESLTFRFGFIDALIQAGELDEAAKRLDNCPPQAHRTAFLASDLLLAKGQLDGAKQVLRDFLDKRDHRLVRKRLERLDRSHR